MNVICCQMTTFSDWLTSQLRERQMSPAELSRLIRKDQSVVSRILNTERSPANETLEAIARALKLPAAQVFQAAGILPPSMEDPWVEEMDGLLSEIPESRRELARKLILSLAEKEAEDKLVKNLRVKPSVK